MCIKISYRIMAHPSRKGNVTKLLHSLNMVEDIVIWDDREGENKDSMYTAMKAWFSEIPEDCTHLVVIQDDSILCENFTDIVKTIAESKPHTLFTFFDESNFDESKRYYKGCLKYAVAIMIPVIYLNDLKDFLNNRIYRYCTDPERILKLDGHCLNLWAVNSGYEVLTTNPSLVQHIGDNSLLGVERVRRSKSFIKNPPVTGW